MDWQPIVERLTREVMATLHSESGPDVTLVVYGRAVTGLEAWLASAARGGAVTLVAPAYARYALEQVRLRAAGVAVVTADFGRVPAICWPFARLVLVGCDRPTPLACALVDRAEAAGWPIVVASEPDAATPGWVPARASRLLLPPTPAAAGR